MSEYFKCPYCGNNYAGRVPKGGDGSMLFFPKHKRKNHLEPFRQKMQELCPGSNQEVITDPNSFKPR